MSDLRAAFHDYMLSAEGAGSVQAPVVVRLAQAVAEVINDLPSRDPLSPQWEDCKVCGGDHWTKDHPAPEEPGLDVERLARALCEDEHFIHGQWEIAPERHRETHRRHARNIAAAYESES